MNEQQMIEHFTKNRHFAEMRDAHLGARAVRLIGLFGAVATGEVEKFNLRPIAKKRYITYYAFGE